MALSDRRADEESGIKRFDPRILDRSVIAIPLLEKIREDENKIRPVIIDLNLNYPDGRDAARDWIVNAIQAAKANIGVSTEEQGVRKKSDLSKQYVFARLSGRVIRELVRLDVEHAGVEAKAATRTKPSKTSAGTSRQQKKRGRQARKSRLFLLTYWKKSSN